MRSFPNLSSTFASRRRALGLLLTAALGVGEGGARAAEGDRPTNDAGARRGSGREFGEGLAGRVVGASGAPLAGVLVVPAPAGGGAGPVPEMAVQTDAAGRFEWPLRPGRYRLDAIKGGKTIGSAVVTVEPGRVAAVTLRADGPQ